LKHVGVNYLDKDKIAYILVTEIMENGIHQTYLNLFSLFIYFNKLKPLQLSCYTNYQRMRILKEKMIINS
jgi:hypothetical protein